MLQLVKSLDSVKYTPRSYIVADTDILSKEKATSYEQELNKGKFEIYNIPRAREVGQSWSSVPLTLLSALLTSSRILLNIWPDLILGIKKIEIVYVESFARVETLSLTGKLLYPFADRFLVQWSELSNILDKAEYKGILV
ncbi:oligosaccharide biosynthesis protein Alg14 like-domain-containing protein [Mucor mucedo]|uniref:oligosaccharide biosynthesis protein Alg14 like-domain-containing protein n=1 Tax=Mucor mucedo TaxID=29922 RepID=UPI002220E5A3|nr:oligosaccharide biosynthesis protein Alg14 like-domain-containing protein [Mucor mucedo]KAI7884722.1 oligosaccharide biosynthesis protein Alg14 like-domain-containing protein [Mucor mucedo]